MSAVEETTVVPLVSGPGRGTAVPDHRGSWMPNGRMVAARWNELRKRRGLMLLLAGVTVGIPTVYLLIRIVLHAAAPHTYGPAGGYDTYTGLVAAVLDVFGFVVAATLGATAGSVDLTDGMFRHHVVTGRSRLALYFARIPAGLGIIVPLVAVGFAVVCIVSVAAAPTHVEYFGTNPPVQLSRAEFVAWAQDHPKEVVDNFPFTIGPGSNLDTACFPGPLGGSGGPKPLLVPTSGTCSPEQLRAFAGHLARVDYLDYDGTFLTPSVSLMVKTGLWLELEATVAFLVGLGLASLLGQRTVAVVLMVVLELILTPVAVRGRMPHLLNLQRLVLGAASAHLEPGHLPTPFGGGVNEQMQTVHETTAVAICVVVGWVVVWTALGAWRMATRDT